MKTLDIHHCAALEAHVEMARGLGDDTLGKAPPEEFFKEAPRLPGFEKVEPGCLLSFGGCVMPHEDSWLGGMGQRNRRERSVFWLLEGEVAFKVDGYQHRMMRPGNWVVFDHRREHMVLANDGWLGAAWQIGEARNAVRNQLVLECLHSDEHRTLMSKGHHDKAEFLAACSAWLGSEPVGWGEIEHGWCRSVPAGRGERRTLVHQAQPHARGAYPVTKMSEQTGGRS